MIQKFQSKGVEVEGCLVTDENLPEVRAWLGFLWDRLEPTVGKVIFIKGDRMREHSIHELDPLEFESIYDVKPASPSSALRAAQPLTREGLLEIKERLYETQRGAFYDDNQIDAFITALLDSLADKGQK